MTRNPGDTQWTDERLDAAYRGLADAAVTPDLARPVMAAIDAAGGAREALDAPALCEPMAWAGAGSRRTCRGRCGCMPHRRGAVIRGSDGHGGEPQLARSPSNRCRL